MRFLRCKKCKSNEFVNRVAIEIKDKKKIIWHRNPSLVCEKCGKAYGAWNWEEIENELNKTRKN